MKRLFVLFALIAFATNAFGQEGLGEDVRVFASEKGANARLLALTYSIEKNIAMGEEIITTIDSQGNDTAELQILLDELKALKTELGQVSPGQGEETAKAYADIRQEATEISREFRESARIYFTEGNATELRKRLKQIYKDEFQVLKNQIKEDIRVYNAEKLSEILDAAGVENDSLIQEYKNGNITGKELKGYIKDVLKAMNKTERKQARIEMKEVYVKSNVFKKSAIDKIVYKQTERIEKKIQKRLDNAAELNLSEERQDKMRKRLNRLNSIQNKSENKIIKRIGKLDNITQKRLSRLEDKQDKINETIQRRIDRYEDMLSVGNLTEEQRQKILDKIDEITAKAENKSSRLVERQEKIENRREKAKGWIKRGMGGGL